MYQSQPQTTLPVLLGDPFRHWSRSDDPWSTTVKDVECRLYNMFCPVTVYCIWDGQDYLGMSWIILHFSLKETAWVQIVSRHFG